MKPIPAGALLLPLMLLAGCASAPKATTGSPAPAGTMVAGVAQAEAEPEAVADVAPVPADGQELPPPPAGTEPESGEPALAGAPEAADEAAEDFAALYGTPADAGPGARPAYDPWEPMNRRIHAFNNVVDRTVARPVARAYVKVVPEPVRLGVGNFFDNLASPVTFLNQLL